MDDMLYCLTLHEDAVRDLRMIKIDDQWSAARLTVLLEEIENDQSLLKGLIEQGFVKDKPLAFDIDRWQQLYRQGYNLWRIKAWDANDKLIPYRIIYSHLIQDEEDGMYCYYHVLAIVKRDWEYDPSHLRSRQILQAYEQAHED